MQPQGQHDLAFPQGNGVEDGVLDLVQEHFVVVLHQPDLGGGLDGDGFAQLQVMDPLLKPVHGVLKIPHHLGAHGVAGGGSLGVEDGEGRLPDLCHFFLPGGDIDLQLLEIGQVLVIQAVEHGDVLEHLHPGLFQGLLNFVDLHLQLFIALEEFF